MVSAFSPFRDKRIGIAVNEKLYNELKELSTITKRSMSEIAHIGIELIVKKLQKEHKKEGK